MKASSLFVAAQSLLRRPLRSSLSFLALLFGATTLVLIDSAGTLVRDAITRDAVLTGGKSPTALVTVQTGVPVQEIDRLRGLVTRSLPGSAASVEAHVEAVAFLDGEPVGEAEIVVVDADMARIKPFAVRSGAWFAPSRGAVAPLVVLNEAAASRAVAGDVSLRFPGGSVTAVRVGVVADGHSDPMVYVERPSLPPGTPLDQPAMLLHAPGVEYSALAARVRELTELADATRVVTEVQRHDRIAELEHELTTTTRVFVGVAVLSLVIGALGIMNVGLSTLHERSMELSLRRSFGATRPQVVAMMLLEAILVAVLAAAAAVGTALLLRPTMLTIMGGELSVEATFPWAAARLGLTASTAAALAGALAPAARAARVPISEIMRA